MHRITTSPLISGANMTLLAQAQLHCSLEIPKSACTFIKQHVTNGGETERG